MIHFCSGWFTKPISEEDQAKISLMNEYLRQSLTEDDLQLDFEAVNNQSLHDMLANLTSVPHLAGDFQDLILAKWINNKFMQFGLDHSEVNKSLVIHLYSLIS